MEKTEAQGDNAKVLTNFDLESLRHELTRFYRDAKFVYDDPSHTYTYEGYKYISVTTFIDKFKKPFDRELMLTKTAIKRGVDRDELDKEWQYENDHANVLGTFTHNWIEDYFNKKFRELPADPEYIVRINKFNRLFAQGLHKLEPFMMENKIYCHKWKIAGTMDAVFYDYTDGGRLFILDWKTNKKMDTDADGNPYNKFLLKPFNEYADNKLNYYSIQLCLYAEMLLEEYGIDIKQCYVVYIPGGETEPAIHRCREFRPILREYLNGEEYLSSLSSSSDQVQHPNQPLRDIENGSLEDLFDS